MANCSACHGADASGVQGLGKGLHNNEFVQGNTDEEMMEFINTGRPADDPEVHLEERKAQVLPGFHALRVDLRISRLRGVCIKPDGVPILAA